MRRRMNGVTWVVLLGLCAGGVPCAAADPGDGWNEVAYLLSHPDGHPEIADYACATYRVSVVEQCPHALRITVAIPRTLPSFSDPYPPEDIPFEITPYLEPTPRVQSEDEVVVKLADRILASVPRPRTQEDVVAAVIRWTSEHMEYALPNEVPDAVTCIKRHKGNCIGFTHVAAALLRHLGIPARTVRALFVCPNCGKGSRLPGPHTQAYGPSGRVEIQEGVIATGYTHMLRHSVVEVYYPKSGQWAMYEPQGACPVDALNIRLASHVGWDSATQKKAQKITKDPKTHIYVFRPGETTPHTH